MARDPDREPLLAESAPRGEGGDHDADHAAALEEIQRLRVALGREESRRQELLASTSWKVTAPLRALKTSGWRGTLKALASDPRSLARGTSEVGRPMIPPPMRADHDGTPEASNDAYRLIDAAAALSPVLKAASTASEGGAGPRIFFLGSNELAGELAFDARVVRAVEENWQSQLAGGRFDFALVETVWHVGHREWRYALVGDAERSDDLVALLSRCREISLPVVLWFREDLRNYERFSWLGQHADLIYAVDEPLRDRLAADYPDRRVQVLPVAIQPALHNPIQSYALRESRGVFDGQVLFDGWWELSAGVAENALFKTLRGVGLRVCESEWEFAGVRLSDCGEFSGEVLGCVEPLDKIALNKMFALEVFFDGAFGLPWRKRRSMFRAVACGSIAIGPSVVEAAGLLPELEKALDCRSTMELITKLRADALFRSSLAHKLRRQLLSDHCVADRLSKIARDLGISVRQPVVSPKVTMILVTMRPQLLAGCLDRFRADLYPAKELTVVLHGEHDLEAAKKLVRPGEPIKVMQIGKERSLGACLNQAIELSEGEYWAKVDDDDLYGPQYLTDLMLNRRVIDFELAGKPPMFAYLEGSDALYHDSVWEDHANLWHDPEEATAALVAGGTLIGKRALLDGVRFCEKRRGGSDSDFIRRCYEQGHGVLAADGFNFVRYRNAVKGFHTWQMDERDLLDRATRIGSHQDIEKEIFI